MKLIIDIPENDYSIYSDYSEREIANDLSYYERIIAKGKPIHGNATVCDIEQIRTEVADTFIKYELGNTKICFDVLRIIDRKGDKE